MRQNLADIGLVLWIPVQVQIYPECSPHMIGDSLLVLLVMRRSASSIGSDLAGNSCWLAMVAVSHSETKKLISDQIMGLDYE